jgi:hypothetical protein
MGRERLCSVSDGQVLALHVIRMGIMFFFMCSLFCVLLLVAKGWSIVRYRLPATEWRAFYGALHLPRRRSSPVGFISRTR